MNEFLMAWRNLWRNRRRTLITAASVFFAVFFALVMRGFQLGTYDRLFRNVIESYTGYLQVQQVDYFDDPSIDNSFDAGPELFSRLSTEQNVKAVVPRLESFALAASGSRTQGVIVMGIDPVGENEVSDLASRLVSYRLVEDAIEEIKKEKLPEKLYKLLDVFKDEYYAGTGRLMQDLGISEDDSAQVLPLLRKHASFRNEYLGEHDNSSALIGSGLSKFLRLEVGDTLVLIGQGYQGTSAAGKYQVKGIVKLPSPDIDNLIVYLPLEAARELYAAYGRATSAVIRLNDNDDEKVDLTASALGPLVGEGQTIKTWRELNALMINQMDADNKSGMIMIGILYLVIAFGVFGTVLMMLAERRREFGMLVSIGMQKRKLARVVTWELLMVGLLGLIAGALVSLPVVVYGNIHPLRFTGEMARMYEEYGFEPVMPTMMPDMYYLWQTVVVMVILMIAIGFSVRQISKINVISSLRA